MSESRDIFLTPGTRVRLDLMEDEGGPEFGIVIHCWPDAIVGHDCYVAFFGSALPTGAPSEKPYVLRYASSSLVVV